MPKITDLPLASSVDQFNDVIPIVDVNEDVTKKVTPKQISDFVNGNYALLQTSNYASKKIDKGTFVVWNGVLYSARVDIAAGTALDTTKLGVVEDGALNIINSKVDEIANAGYAKSFNGVPADEYGDLKATYIETAGNLVSDDAQSSTGEYIIRTTGGDASLSDGIGWVTNISGNIVHNGYVPESLNLSVDMADRTTEDVISATINRDTFVGYVSDSGTYTLTYNGSSWSASPTLYGVTVTGTPISGDRIIITYVKEIRGTIITATPTAYKSTGWNLYNNTVGYAIVTKYSETYGYKVGGSYTSIQYSETISGSKQTLSPSSNNVVQVPGDGFVWINGGDDTTYLYPTWSDWGEGYEGAFAVYEESIVDISSIMQSYFAFGLCRVGSVRDEISLSTGVATSRIGRVAYNATNLANIINSGVDYEYDENYIYYVKQSEDAYAISIDDQVNVADHGTEIIVGTNIPVLVSTLYGQNLKDKLRTDVVTISSQTLTEQQKAQVRTNIGAADGADVVKLSSQSLTAEQKTQVQNNIGVRVQRGTISGVSTGSTEMSGWYISSSTSITFPQAFSSAPTVIIQESGGNGARFYRFRTNSITATGFSGWLIANAANYTPDGTRWIAIGT